MNDLIGLCKRSVSLSLVGLALIFPTMGFAGPIAFDSFLEFGFDGAGSVTGCNPADPGGAFCTPSFATPTSFLDAPPWTFTAPAAGATVTVTDAFTAGDRFEVFDFGASVGLTSAPVGNGDCGDDPIPCLADPNMSKRVVAFASGDHSITIQSLTDGLGSAYLKVSAVPEPDALLLFGVGALAVYLAARRRRAITVR